MEFHKILAGDEVATGCQKQSTLKRPNCATTGKKSSIIKATAVKKTNIKKKRRDAPVATVPGVEDYQWRPLEMGAFMEPPRLSEEVHPCNLQGLFDNTKVSSTPKKMGKKPSEKIGVFVRIRPFSGQDTREACLYAHDEQSIGVAPPLGSLAYKNGDCYKGQKFAFQKVFGPETSQEAYFTATARKLVDSMAESEAHYEGVFLSYGITAAGKTYTIQGTKENPGIIPLALEYLYTNSHLVSGGIKISYCEIYNESISDLLKTDSSVSSHAMKLMDGKDGLVHVMGLSWHSIDSAQEGWNILKRGLRQRKKAETKLNYSSSRSHSIFSIQAITESGRKKISFVDLAGSERTHRTGNMGARLKEAVAINGSLMTLGRCLEALRYNQQVKKTGNLAKVPFKMIPYRESKVTHMFRDAFHGYGHIVLSVNVSASSIDFDETLRVLKYAVLATGISTIERQQVPKRKLLAQTPAGLRKYRNMMEQKSTAALNPMEGAPKPEKDDVSESETQGEVVYNIGMEQSISIDSRVPVANQATNSIQASEMMNKRLISEVENPRRESISFGTPIPNPELDLHEETSSPNVLEMGEQNCETTETNSLNVEHSLRSQIKTLEKQLKEAQQKMDDIEGDVREEVAIEMAQIVDSLEEKHKKRLSEESIIFEEKVKGLKMRHDEERQKLLDANRQQEMEIKELLSEVQRLGNISAGKEEIIQQAHESSEKYKLALDDALAEIERLHVVIEQEEATNARLASSVSAMLREQSSPLTPDSFKSDSDRKSRRFKQEVMQIEANNAMEKEMCDHLIDRLKKDNEELKRKISAITRAIEKSSSPERNSILQRLLTLSPSGVERGASGTPHDIALARARRACTEEIDKSPKTSRFAKEVILSQNQGEEMSQPDIVDLLTPTSTANELQQDDDPKEYFVDEDSLVSDKDPLVEKVPVKMSEECVKGGQHSLQTRVTRRMAKMKADEDLTPKEKKAPHPKGENADTPNTRPKRKLLSTAKKQLPKSTPNAQAKILGVSNKNQGKRTLPDASELGFTAGSSLGIK